MSFPHSRLRRLRQSSEMLSLTSETRLSVEDFVYPMFVIHGHGKKIPIEPMPGIYQLSVDMLAEEIKEVTSLGIRSVLLFGIPETKDATGSGGIDTNGVIQVAIREIKTLDPNLIVMTDVCLCDYTDHGHCGIIKGSNIDNDATLPLLQEMAVSHAQNGADVVAPSAMMDGQVGAIRSSLDSAGKKDTVIMGYSSKFASGFYGPFRVAAQSAPQFGYRTSYQADPANVRQAMLELEQDIEEGADIIMVKPALSYLDVIRAARESFDLPLAAYNVSGEYSMVKAASASDWIEGDRVRDEILTSIKRAGADIIISYHAKEIASAV